MTAQQPAPTAKPAPDATAAAREFEAMFMTQMVDEMLKQVDMGSMGAGQAEQHFRYFLSEAIAEQMVEQGGTGLSRSLNAAMSAYAAAQRDEDYS
ncbi:hypothetical protein ATO6_20360 [Oceanicola sp. 22II-s10i]|nr:hypothetical protein ATO6_20360 [Oceanicola sp. 22II-s10i]